MSYCLILKNLWYKIHGIKKAIKIDKVVKRYLTSNAGLADFFAGLSKIARMSELLPITPPRSISN